MSTKTANSGRSQAPPTMPNRATSLGSASARPTTPTINRSPVDCQSSGPVANLACRITPASIVWPGVILALRTSPSATTTAISAIGTHGRACTARFPCDSPERATARSRGTEESASDISAKGNARCPARLGFASPSATISGVGHGNAGSMENAVSGVGEVVPPVRDTQLVRTNTPTTTDHQRGRTAARTRMLTRMHNWNSSRACGSRASGSNPSAT